MDYESKYGGFSFYAHHLVESVCEVFGRYPKSVYAVKKGDVITVIFRYERYDITGIFVQLDYYYSVTRILSCKEENEGIKTEEIIVDEKVFEREFGEFVEMMEDGNQRLKYEEIIAPVYITNAIIRSLESGKEEELHGIKI